MTINTLQIANRLKDAERAGRVPEEIALILQELWEMQLGQLVTKEYLHAELEKLRMEIDARFEHLRAEIDARFAATDRKIDALRADMEKMELRLTNTLTARMGAMIAAAIAILGGLNIFF